jgi:hypothetical protein
VFTAFLDTCTLWPSLQRDFFLTLGSEGVYRPIWSEAILAELQYQETVKLTSRGMTIRRAEASAAILIERMRASFEDAIILGWEPLEGTFGTPDPDDEHVVAAADHGRAHGIVTHNLRDFPASAVPASITVLDPATFAHHLVARNPSASRRAIEQIAARSGHQGPKRTAADIIRTLQDRYGMSGVASLLERPG